MSEPGVEWNMTGTPGGAGPHFHKTFSESFYVMEGTVRLFNGETWIDAVKGDFLVRRTSPSSPTSAGPDAS